MGTGRREEKKGKENERERRKGERGQNQSQITRKPQKGLQNAKPAPNRTKCKKEKKKKERKNQNVFRISDCTTMAMGTDVLGTIQT